MEQPRDLSASSRVWRRRSIPGSSPGDAAVCSGASVAHVRWCDHSLLWPIRNEHCFGGHTNRRKSFLSPRAALTGSVNHPATAFLKRRFMTVTLTPPSFSHAACLISHCTDSHNHGEAWTKPYPIAPLASSRRCRCGTRYRASCVPPLWVRLLHQLRRPRCHPQRHRRCPQQAFQHRSPPRCHPTPRLGRQPSVRRQ